MLDESGGFPWARWFVDGKLNIVRNCLDRHAAGPRAGLPALEWVSEGGERRTVSYAELDREVCRVANAMKAAGMRRGDTVGLYMPMVPELVVRLLRGAQDRRRRSSPSSRASARTRWRRGSRTAPPRMLFTADGSVRRGKPIATKPDADRAVELYPGIETVVVVDRLGAANAAPRPASSIAMVPGRDVWWTRLPRTAQPTRARPRASRPRTRSMIIFTSGTTGRPKGTVHTHAGCLAQMAKELGYAFDVKPDDVFFWVTDIGWMMGPWELIGVHFFGATVVLFEGAPNWPHPGRLWEVCAELKATHLGISPTAIRLLMTRGASSTSTGTISPVSSTWARPASPGTPTPTCGSSTHVGGGRVPIINISGGTEIVGCFLHAAADHRAQADDAARARARAWPIDCVDDDGEPVREQIGYLVCRRPAPSMTKGFLNDPERYIDTYFSRFGPDMWFHGDWALRRRATASGICAAAPTTRSRSAAAAPARPRSRRR